MHILAVDDNLTIRQLITLTLKSTTDIHVTAAETGAEALEMTAKTPFDLILIDWSMHPMDGQDLLSAIRQQALHSKTPVIVLSADSNADQKQKAKHLGANGWMVKPFHPNKLIELIRQMTTA